MGIFSKWAAMTPSVTKLEVVENKAVSDLEQGSASLAEFLRERRLVETDYSGAEDKSQKAHRRFGARSDDARHVHDD